MISSFLSGYCLNDWYVTIEKFAVLRLQKIEPQGLVSSALLKKLEEATRNTDLKN